MQLDHFAWSAPSLDQAMDDFEKWSGIRPVHGGSHPGMGTRNALVSLGADMYLAIDGPDPAQVLVGNNGAKMASQQGRKLDLFAVATNDLERAQSVFEAHGIPAEIRSGSRLTPSGELLEWAFLDAAQSRFGLALPHVVKWKTKNHPSLEAPVGCFLVSFAIAHPEAIALGAFYSDLGLELAVHSARSPGLKLELAGKKGGFNLPSFDD